MASPGVVYAGHRLIYDNYYQPVASALFSCRDGRQPVVHVPGQDRGRVYSVLLAAPKLWTPSAVPACPQDARRHRRRLATRASALRAPPCAPGARRHRCGPVSVRCVTTAVRWQTHREAPCRRVHSRHVGGRAHSLCAYPSVPGTPWRPPTCAPLLRSSWRSPFGRPRPVQHRSIGERCATRAVESARLICHSAFGRLAISSLRGAVQMRLAAWRRPGGDITSAVKWTSAFVCSAPSDAPQLPHPPASAEDAWSAR